MSAESNACGAFSVLLSVDHHFVTLFKKNTDDASIRAVTFALLGCYAGRLAVSYRLGKPVGPISKAKLYKTA
jgi:hypothetical protein